MDSATWPWLQEVSIIRVPRFFKILLVLVLAALGIFGYTKLMSRIGSGTPPAISQPDQQADHILVSKQDKMMYLLRDGKVLRSYQIAMGTNWADGHKEREGDERTPEGSYSIDWRNAKSVAHLSLHISYPDENDRKRADEGGIDPGGNIMIHGLPNGWGALGSLHRIFDWTDGCIAVTNQEMQEIWALTPTNTPITIAAHMAPEGEE